MKGDVWISRRQLRWLLVLLALLPLVPTIFMVRMMLDNAQRDRDVAVAEVTGVYRDQLARYVDRFSVEAEKQHGTGTSPQDLTGYVRRVFGPEVSLRVMSPDGSWQLATGPPLGRDATVVEINVGIYSGWSVELDQVADLPDSIDEQVSDAYRRAVIVIVVVAAVAGLVYWVVSGRIRVDVLKADLMSTVSHEMKTPLASMRVLLETLAEGRVDDEERRAEYLAILLRENQRLARLAEQFLTVSRLERGEVKLASEAVLVGELCEDVVASLVPQANERRIDIVVSVPPSCRVMANRDALAAVLGNLVDNSMKYGPSDSRVSVVAKLPGDGESQVTIEVSDCGEPIADGEAEHIFERFYQSEDGLNRSGGGVGLGLAISRQLIELMDGQIGWRRGAGDRDRGCRGNVFFVELPSCLQPTGERALSEAEQRVDHG